MTTRKSTTRIPSYRLHAPSGLGVVRLNGRDSYLAKHGTPESRREYARLIQEWLANNKLLPSDDTPAGRPTASPRTSFATMPPR